MTTADLTKTGAAVILLGIAAFFFVQFLREGHSAAERSFFYDLSEQKLFVGPRTAIPPIKGLNDERQDGMRAVVVSPTGDSKDKSSWKIAYLEMYSADLKAQMETAQATGGSLGLSRAQALGHHFVRRLTDVEWFPMNSAEAERIVTEWASPGANGITPVVCAP